MTRASFARRAILPLGASLAIAAQGSAGAQPQPGFRPARMIVPAPAGSAPDLCARLLADGLSRRRGHPIVVENRPGADGVLGAEAFAQARPGEALFFSFTGVVTVVPAMRPPVPYDPDADLVPVHAAVTDFLGLVVRADLPVRSVADLAAYARARPGALNWFGSPGGPELVFRDFLRGAGGLDLAYVAYRGSPPALVDLAAGRLHVVLTPLAPAMPMLHDGRLRLLAVTNTTRARAMPEVPTVTEAGFPALTLDGLLGLFGWRGMADAARTELAAQAHQALAEPAVTERLHAAGMEPRGAGSPAAFTAELAAQRDRWAGLAREFGAKPPG